MVGKYFIIGLVVLLAGCAQVGQISGGPKDEMAPKPDLDRMVPAQASTNYTGNTIVVPFDEYFTLDKPSQTIVMVPPHATVQAEIKRKTLTLSWEETLEPNTTYAIYLNGTVRDVNEKNDTTLQFVFATGDQIDTLSYTVPLMDAFTQEPLSDMTVALFDQQSNKLLSLGKSSNGVAKLNYLRAGTYQLVAFEDENGDLEIQEQERIGFPNSGLVTIDSNYFDSVPLRVFTPKETPKIVSVEGSAPCLYTVTFNEFMHSVPSIRVDGEALDDEAFNMFDPMEGVFFYNAGDKKSFQVVAQNATPELNDTTTLRIKPLKDSSLVIVGDPDARINSETNEATVEIETNAWFYKGGAVDTSLIVLHKKGDSIDILPTNVSFEHKSFTLTFPATEGGEYEITMAPGAITSACSRRSKQLSKVIQIREEKDFGVLRINLSAYDSPVFVDVMKGKEVVQTGTVATEDGIAEFTLLPGEYWFRVVLDDNENNVWDPGDYSTLTQPERIDIYSKTSKVRANWTVDLTLTPSESP